MFDHGNLLIFGLGGWALICTGLAHFAGWRSLAREYRATAPFQGRRFHFCSAQFGAWVGYNGSFTPGADHSGLFVAVWPIFRIGHPSLLVPWSEIHASVEKRRWVTVVLLRFAKLPSARVRITFRLAERLAAESAGFFRVPDVLLKSTHPKSP
ncbi:MAG: hypothetical protein ACE5HE_12610 [Phycisphaerae bacterium]